MAVSVNEAIQTITELDLKLNFEIIPIEDSQIELVHKIYFLKYVYQDLTILQWMDMELFMKIKIKNLK